MRIIVVVIRIIKKVIRFTITLSLITILREPIDVGSEGNAI